MGHRRPSQQGGYEAELAIWKEDHTEDIPVHLLVLLDDLLTVAIRTCALRLRLLAA